MARLREIEIPPRSMAPRIVFFVAIALGAVLALLQVRTWLTPKAVETVEVRAAPDVVLAMKDLARLETANFHMEKVIEIADHQKSMFGLVEAKDQLLLVAVGDVDAGIDFEKIDSSQVKTDWTKRSVTIVLPQPE